MAESDFFYFRKIQMQGVLNFTIESRCDVTMHVQSHELRHGCRKIGLHVCFWRRTFHTRRATVFQSLSEGRDVPSRVRVLGRAFVATRPSTSL